MHQVPGRAIAEQAGYQRGVHRVSGALGHDPAKDAMSHQGKVPNQVKHFVADEFVVKTKRAVLHLAIAENDRVLFGSAADQPHIPQHFFIFAEAEGAGGGDLRAKGSGGEVDGECLAADGVQRNGCRR